MEFTDRNRLPLLEQGGLGRYWSSMGMNKVIYLIDDALDGVIDLSECNQRKDGAYILSLAKGSFDAQRQCVIKVDYSLSSAPIRIVVPKSEKVYNFAISPAIGVFSATNSIIVEQEETGSEVTLGFSDVTQFGAVDPSTPYIVKTIISTSKKLYSFGSKKKKEVIITSEQVGIVAGEYNVTADGNGKVVMVDTFDISNTCDIILPPADELPDGYEIEIIVNGGIGIVTAPSVVELFEGSVPFSSGILSYGFLRIRKDTSTADAGVGKYLIMV